MTVTLCLTQHPCGVGRGGSGGAGRGTPIVLLPAEARVVMSYEGAHT